MLSAANDKLLQEVQAKDSIIDAKSLDISVLNKNVAALSEQLATIKAGAAEKVSHLEREIQLLRSELEEGKLSKVRELEQQRSSMQANVDQINKSIEERDSKVSSLNAQLNKIKQDQEEEGVNLGVFIGKSVHAMALANASSQENGNYGTLLVESQSNVGFSKLTLKTLINGDISSSLKL